MSSWSWYATLLPILLIPTAALFGFVKWIKRQPQLGFEQKAKAWEVFISLLSAITSLAGGLLLIGKYVDEQSSLERDRIAQTQRESKLREAEFGRQEVARIEETLARTKSLYEQVMTLAVQLSNLDESEVSQVKNGPERKQFEELYWAKLIGVESREVESAMVVLRRRFEEWVSTRKKDIAIRQDVLALSTSCRDHTRRIAEIIEEKNRKIADLILQPR